MWLVLSLSSLFDGPYFLDLHWRSEILSQLLSHGIEFLLLEFTWSRCSPDE